MKNLFYIFIFSLSSSASFCQTWQWGKRGGSNDQLNTSGTNRQEEVYSIVTDSNKNIYILSTIGQLSLNIDGIPKMNFGDSTTITDIALASFSCDGSYRWSKIIGGQGVERIHSLQIDSDDNIYIAGQFLGCGNNSFPPRIENDVTISQSPPDCSTIFIAKFNSDGIMQWFKRPQQAGVSASVGLSQTTSRGLTIDTDGNCYWLIFIPPGTYADGTFINSLSGSNWYIFKYNSAGNFLNATLLDMQLGGTSGLFLEFYRNNYNTHFYITLKKEIADSAVIGGQTLAHTICLASFDNQGQFLWLRENTSTSSGRLSIYNILFDEQSNIYLGGRMVGQSTESFLGFTIIETLSPGFVMKVNPNADMLLWSTYHNKGTLQRGAIVLNDEELGFTSYGYGSDLTWGSQVLNVNALGQGNDVLFARFNKDSGECIGLDKIPGNPNYNDAGTALAVDASGDYILGGGFGHQLTINGNTLTNPGPQSDFFIAKYATSPCSPLAINEPAAKPAIQVYPNPADTEIKVTVRVNTSYEIVNV